jgi:hypothetical protein
MIEILENIKTVVTVEKIIKPIYNFKASGLIVRESYKKTK